MANPTPAAIDTINARIKALSLDPKADEAMAVEALNAIDQPNPEPQAKTLIVLTGRAVLGILSPASQGAVIKLPVVTRILDEINSQDRAGCVGWTYALAGAGVITESEAAAILAFLEATEPDPNWPKLVSWASLNLSRDADADDVATATASSTGA